MLSICLPVYNVNITKLVENLNQQAIFNDLTLEVLAYDDGSKPEFKEANRNIKNIRHVKYLELPKNLGSAAIRNKLAADASFDNILFMDSDSGISSDYLLNYIPYIKSKHIIVYGGRIHPKSLPSRDKSLRWEVGKKKEDHPAEIRQLIPNKSFMSNNFLAKKNLFNTIKFDESIPRSGHEDTMFGIELELNGINIFHINNPVVHIGLESNNEFITKTEQRLETLKYLEAIQKNNPLFFKRITMLRYFKWVKKFRLTLLFSSLFNISKNWMTNKLLIKHPSMLIYDLYKLGYYSNLSK